MPQPLSAGLSEVRSMLLDDQLVRAVASGRRRGQVPRWRRAELRPVELKSGRRLQVTAYDDAQAHTRNEEPGGAAHRVVDALLDEPFGNWHVETSSEVLQLRVTKRGEAQLHRSARESAGGAVVQPHDRQKVRLLPPADPVWRTLGITDERGVVKPTRARKHRQVEEFLRLLDGGVDEASAAGLLPQPSSDRPLEVVDLGCGNAYLTFAAFRFLSSARDLPIRMLGVDRSRYARDRNDRLTAELGWTGQLRFVEGSIEGAAVDTVPDVVLSLHACDTATDEALARAVRWRSPLLLVAPCCHHDLQVQLRRAAAPSPYGLMLRQGILRERFADVLTDALRAALLRLLGYRVDVVQFVGDEHTPRNVLLRAVRTGAPPPAGLQQEYAELTASWSVTPALQRMLAAEVGEALAS